MKRNLLGFCSHLFPMASVSIPLLRDCSAGSRCLLCTFPRPECLIVRPLTVLSLCTLSLATKSSQGCWKSVPRCDGTFKKIQLELRRKDSTIYHVVGCPGWTCLQQQGSSSCFRGNAFLSSHLIAARLRLSSETALFGEHMSAG